MEYRWVEKKPGQWWHAQIVDGKPWLGGSGNVIYPPDMYVEFAADPQGKPLPVACVHLWRLLNGAMPDDADEASDEYLHLCDSGAVDDWVEALTQLKRIWA